MYSKKAFLVLTYDTSVFNSIHQLPVINAHYRNLWACNRNNGGQVSHKIRRNLSGAFCAALTILRYLNLHATL